MNTKTFTPTPFQEAFFSALQQGRGNILLSAVAGSGKTSTIIHSLSKISHLGSRQVLLAAFNKHIASELSGRQQRGEIPFEVKISTLHALGHRAIINYNTFLPHLDKKEVNLLKRIEGYSFDKEWFGVSNAQGLSKEDRNYMIEYCGLVCRLISYAKLTFSLDVETLSKAAEKFNLYQAGEHHIERAVEILAAFYIGTKPAYIESISFEDMIFLPLIYQLPLPAYDLIYIDECQDVNKSMFQLLKKLRKDEGRIIAVGDKQQAIYGFAGADTNAYENFLKLSDTTELPLSESFRCPKAVVRFVNAVCNPHISAFKENIEGELRYGSYLEAADKDLILCRTNDPLVSLCLEYLTRGRKATIKGKDFGYSLLKLLEEVGHISLTELSLKLDLQLANLKERLFKKYGEGQAVETHKSYIQLKEKVDCLKLMALHSKSVEEVMEHIKSLFSDQVSGIILSTIHKAKGMEADKVFILFDNLTPSSLAQRAEEIEQETNLLYVAYTRAKHSLIFINDFTRAHHLKEEVQTHSKRLDWYLTRLTKET